MCNVYKNPEEIWFLKNSPGKLHWKFAKVFQMNLRIPWEGFKLSEIFEDLKHFKQKFLKNKSEMLGALKKCFKKF